MSENDVQVDAFELQDTAQDSPGRCALAYPALSAHEPAPSTCYASFFECFNHQKYFEAHDALEKQWLANRHTPEANFYKGLIQLAGAFVHLQKKRIGPAVALLQRSSIHLTPYAPIFMQLDLRALLSFIESLISDLRNGEIRPDLLAPHHAPKLGLMEAQEAAQSL